MIAKTLQTHWLVLVCLIGFYIVKCKMFYKLTKAYFFVSFD